MYKSRPESTVRDIHGCLPPDGPLLVVCHDAGAANLIFAWLWHWLEAGTLNRSDLLLALAGPARTIAERTRLAAQGRPSSLENFPDQVGCVLSGTGWQSDWEHRARQLARNHKIHSIAVVDHWVNYPARFVRDDEYCLPDELWVSDEYAERIATQTFPSLRVRRQPNLYLAREIAQIPPLAPAAGDTLYLLEPTRTTWGRTTEGEFQALDYFIHQRHLIMPCPEPRIRLRLHPSEPADKYNEWIATNGLHTVRIDDAEDLAASIGCASVVVGIQTAALVIALAAGRTVYSSLPPWAGELIIPHEDIRQLRKLNPANF
jgi:hypothetical protein